MNAPLLELRDVSAGYGDRQILQGINFKLKARESMAITGANGCGKSSLLRAVAGELRLQQGAVFLDGHALPPELSARIRLGLGYLRQSRHTFDSLTVVDNLALAAGDSSSRSHLVCEAFPDVARLGSTRAGLLSGGQRKQLAIAMVLSRPARLLLLDEPFSGLSPEAATTVQAALARFQEFDGFAMIVAEHRHALINQPGWQPWHLANGRISCG